MNLKSIQTDELKDKVVKAAEEFYLAKNNGLNLTDLEYDEMLDELKSREPDFDIFKNLPGLNGTTVDHQVWFPSANKTKVNNIDWLILGIKFTTLLSIVNESSEYPFILHYQNSQLKRITIVDPSHNYRQLAIVDFPNQYFPARINVQGTFRIAGLAKISKSGLSDIKIISLLPETETAPSDWIKIRAELVKSEQYINFDLCSPDYKSHIIENLGEVRKYDQWWNCAIVDISDSFSPKMDGCSITAYYKNDKLWYICSRSNDVTGKLKTNYLRDIFPKEIPGIGNTVLMCESVIDLIYGFDWNSRQQANGLINSKYKAAEVSKFLSFVCYDAINYETNVRINLDNLRKLLYEVNPNNRLRLWLKNNSTPAILLSASPIFINDVLLGHIKGVHALREVSESLSKIVIVKGYKFDEISSDYHKVVTGILTPKQINEINNVNSIPKISGFEHGIIQGIRYCKVDYCEGEPEYFFDSRDLYRPRLTTVDYFKITEISNYLKDDCQAHYYHSDGGIYLNDGLVIHTSVKDIKRSRIKGNPEDTLYPFHRIYKWTYNEIAETEVENIIWQESPFSTLIPIIQFKGVSVEGSWLTRTSAGGLSKLMALGCGPGSKIKVVRVNSTIPMVLQVLTKSEIKLPVCPHCGRQLTWKDDVYETLGGALILKCSNELCEGKFKNKSWFLNQDSDYHFDINENLIETIIKLTPIESYKSRTSATDEILELLKLSINVGDFNSFRATLIDHVFVNMNRDKLNTFDNNLRSTFIAIRRRLNLELEK